MVAAQEKLTLKDFQEFVNRDENSGRLFELINGEIIEKLPTTTRSSEFGSLIMVAVRRFCKETNIPCHTSGSDGAYVIGEHIIAPDFAYKPTGMSDEYSDPVPPLFVAEVVSSTETAMYIRSKREIYRHAGILLWEMYPKSESMDVYAPGQPPRTYTIDETLDAGDVLPGFTLSMRKLFEPR